MNERVNDLIGGIRNALERGSNLQQAKQTFLNAGYTQQEVEQAASYFPQSQQPAQQPASQTSQPSTQPQPQQPQTKKLPQQEQAKPGAFSRFFSKTGAGLKTIFSFIGTFFSHLGKKKIIIIILIIISIMILIAAALLGLYWEILFAE
ncbi:MAG: hypothetical protein ACP5D2_02620 [Candidatus Nanoarchaeia archaeon]